MTITEYYVGTTGTDDLAAGRGQSAGNPWRTPEYALDTGIPNYGQGAGGDRLNIAAGTYTLSKNLATCTYFSSYTPTSAKTFQIRGAGLTTILDGNGAVSIFYGSISYVHISDLTARHTGSTYLLRVGNYCSARRCRVHDGIYGWYGSATSPAIDCEFFDIGGAYCVSGSAIGCRLYWSSGSKEPTTAWIFGNGWVERNVVALGTGSTTPYAIYAIANGFVCRQNSVYAVANTNTGIYCTAILDVSGNVVSGYSGVGGIGIHVTSVSSYGVHRNAVYNCTTAYSGQTDDNAGVARWYDNETLSSSPFTDPENGDFTPVDTGNVKGNGDGASGGFPDFYLWLPSHPSYPWKGAIQPAAGGGGYTYGDEDPDLVLTTADGAGNYIPIADSDTVDGGVSYGADEEGTGVNAETIRTALGLASANLDTQLAAISGYVDCLPASWVVPAAASVWTPTLATNVGTLVTDWTDGGRLDLILDAIDSDTIAAAVYALLSARSATVAAALTDGGEITIRRGDYWSEQLPAMGSIAGRTALWFTLKRYPRGQDDDQAIIQVTEAGGLVYLNGDDAEDSAYASITIDDEDAGTITLTLEADLTADLELVSGLIWDVQILNAAGKPITMATGTADVIYDTTRAIA